MLIQCCILTVKCKKFKYIQGVNIKEMIYSKKIMFPVIKNFYKINNFSFGMQFKKSYIPIQFLSNDINISTFSTLQE